MSEVSGPHYEDERIKMHTYFFSWIMALAIVLMSIAILWLAGQWQSEKRRAYQMALQLSEIAHGTGFLNVGLANSKDFLDYLERFGFSDPNKPHEWEYKIVDHDLNNLVNTAVDMSKGRANMDVGIAFMEDLDKVMDRLNPQNAPHHYGSPAEKKEN